MASEAVPATLEAIRWLYAFQTWAGERLFAAADRCDVNRWPKAVAGGQGDGSLFDTLAHIVGSEEVWLTRWQGDPAAQIRGGPDFSHLHQLKSTWIDLQARRSDWLATLAEDELAGDLYFVRSSREEQYLPLWQTLLHVANHTTHHRAEACVALTSHGAPPASVDLIDYIRAGSPR